MIIMTSNIRSQTVSGAMAELYDNPDVMDIIEGHNLRGGDVVEAMATALINGDEPIDTDDFLHIC